MGVADIRSRCGCAPFSSSAARCATPKRCCSSAITRPRSAKTVVSVSSAWVPITTSASPAAMRTRRARFCAGVMEPVSNAQRTPRGARSGSSRSKCCRARISVGARSAVWRPFFAVQKAAAAATMVLPLPTSPCTRRLMGRPARKSVRISSIARRCAPVSSKGSAAVKGASSVSA